MEARTLMLASNNVLSPANGEPIIVPSQEVSCWVLYYTTREKLRSAWRRDAFCQLAEVKRVYDAGLIDLHANVTVRIKEYDLDLDGTKPKKSIVMKQQWVVHCCQKSYQPAYHLA